MDSEELQSLSVKILVETEKDEVVFAETDQDFVDVLFSWMTIPVGAIVKLLGNHPFGCIVNLYASVENLDERFLRSKICKEVLLHPRSAAEIYCRNLKVNLCETDDNKYYQCNGCDLVAYYSQTGCCRCGRPLINELELPSPCPNLQGGFTRYTTHFMISDDLQVSPISTETGLTLLKLLGADDTSVLEERTINVGKDKILKLLKSSLASKTPLTEAFLDRLPLNNHSYYNMHDGPGIVDQYEETISSSAKADNTISLKLIINSINNTVLYAEAANDFVDLLFSFLTFPIGYLFEKNLHLPFQGCMDNVYKSIKDNKAELFQTADMKEALLESKLAPGLAQHNKVVSIEDATKPTYSDLMNFYEAERGRTFNNESPNREILIADGFIRGPLSFMIMDNLEVMHLSSISGLCLIKKMQIPFGKIVVKEVVIGEKEAIRLFTASLVAENALTNTFLRDEMKQEQSVSNHGNGCDLNLSPTSSVSEEEIFEHADDEELNSNLLFDLNTDLEDVQEEVITH